MKLNVIFFILFIGLAKSTFAEQGLKNNQMQDHRPFLGLSVPLYLLLLDNSKSYPMEQAQLEIVLFANMTVNNILVTSTGNQDGTCLLIGNTVIIGATSDPTVTLTSGNTYVTTDASNWALSQLSEDNFFTFDTLMQFRNGTTTVGSAVCLPAGGSCTGPTNCGWNSTIVWGP